MGIDVGRAHFLPTSTGQRYGPLNGKLAERHKRDRATRRRKAKLRACLKKSGVKRLPSTRNQQLARTVRQAMNRAGNEWYREHPAAHCAAAQLTVAGMQCTARRMNAGG
jgi:transposase